MVLAADRDKDRIHQSTVRDKDKLIEELVDTLRATTKTVMNAFENYAFASSMSGAVDVIQ
jgi:hypothetical protein